MEEINGITRRIAIIDQGRVLTEGAVDDIHCTLRSSLELHLFVAAGIHRHTLYRSHDGRRLQISPEIAVDRSIAPPARRTGCGRFAACATWYRPAEKSGTGFRTQLTKRSLRGTEPCPPPARPLAQGNHRSAARPAQPAFAFIMPTLFVTIATMALCAMPSRRAPASMPLMSWSTQIKAPIPKVQIEAPGQAAAFHRHQFNDDPSRPP
ncbi:MAG: hypothetical protein IPJ50_18025, partial [Betaproteobacteria bacterium]|nr:hypothetical protein [Betaproteobacteria bacterium]